MSKEPNTADQVALIVVSVIAILVSLVLIACTPAVVIAVWRALL